MNVFHQLESTPEKEIFGGWFGRMIHGENMTISYFRAKAGSILPRHSHPHEQISTVLEGELELTIGEETRICRLGDVAVIPSNVEHQARALTDVRVMDVFAPVREDYR
ncbi:cupin domain-containing protein [Runella sp. SP2]|uniref:cupin domain-containing protein n=1 Tax=Runella sp. SP2 TaxID=2268026 RepID=UPI000F078A05|nr:cupin domain-containing protein [Runella sp. SP2]AYQ36292.1 cupin domain-containing protein [Runella sp. SP2]